MEKARLYLVAPAQLQAGSLATLTPELAAAGVDAIQLREKELEAAPLIAAGEPVADACRAAGIPFILNDRADVALALGADGIHLGQGDLPVEVARRILPGAIVGRSSHARDEIDEIVAAADADYFAVGPVYETPTKPGRVAVGVELVKYAASVTTPPWFAIGGITVDNLDAVMAAGARRVVVVRAITEAAEPVAAAAALREKLDAVPL
jgi:thiamine-phosphate pyrophosphorylase